MPTGPHGAFRDYQVDAVTLELSPWADLHNENAQSAFLLRSGRLVFIWSEFILVNKRASLYLCMEHL